ncbi:hypothetical protein [Sulfurimonas sp.]
MQNCLVKICKEFENASDFLTNKTDDKTIIINKLFVKFIECFASLKEEKLDYPQEFANDIRLYIEGNEQLIKKFEDTEMRYLMISDFYDFCRLTKKL